MKRVFLFLGLIFFLGGLQAQWEVKYNLGALLARSATLHVEKIWGGKIGVESALGYEWRRRVLDNNFVYFRQGMGGRIMGKFYPNREANGKGICLAAYIRYHQRYFDAPDVDFDVIHRRLSTGFQCNYKLILPNGLLIESGIGGGRIIAASYSENPFGDYLGDRVISPIEIRILLLVGYRF